MVDLKIIDQRYGQQIHIYFANMQTRTISLWDQFREVDVAAMSNFSGNFPVAIGMRLKNYHHTRVNF